jgi:hypothetical protein
MEATVNNIFADEKFNAALDAIVSLADCSKLYPYKADICSDVIKHILTYQSLYANRPLSEEDINKKAQCDHTDKDGGHSVLHPVKINNNGQTIVYLKCNRCNSLIDIHPLSAFASGAATAEYINETIAEYMKKDNTEQMAEVYKVLLRDVTIMHGINVELQKLIKAKPKRRKINYKRKSAYNLSKPNTLE